MPRFLCPADFSSLHALTLSGEAREGDTCLVFHSHGQPASWEGAVRSAGWKCIPGGAPHLDPRPSLPRDGERASPFPSDGIGRKEKMRLAWARGSLGLPSQVGHILLGAGGTPPNLSVNHPQHTHTHACTHAHAHTHTHELGGENVLENVGPQMQRMMVLQPPRTILKLKTRSSPS